MFRSGTLGKDWIMEDTDLTNVSTDGFITWWDIGRRWKHGRWDIVEGSRFFRTCPWSLYFIPGPSYLSLSLFPGLPWCSASSQARSNGSSDHGLKPVKLSQSKSSSSKLIFSGAMYSDRSWTIQPPSSPPSCQAHTQNASKSLSLLPPYTSTQNLWKDPCLKCPASLQA
jgi:hypothetical protein